MRNASLLSISIGLVLTATTVSPARATAPARPEAHAGKSSLPFIEDDFARAVAEAKARRVPLFVEAWAPW